jgi:hypothetical protein
MEDHRRDPRLRDWPERLPVVLELAAEPAAGSLAAAEADLQELHSRPVLPDFQLSFQEAEDYQL